MATDANTRALPIEVVKSLEALAKLGPYGSTKEEVAAYLISRGIDDLARCGVIELRANRTMKATDNA